MADKKYVLIEANSSEKLEDGVNYWIEQGYIPTSGFSMVISDEHEWYCQPMLKTDCMTDAIKQSLQKPMQHYPDPH